MILPGGIDTKRVSSLNGIGIGMGVLQMQSGDYVDPLEWRKGIQGLGVLPLTPGLHGIMDFPGSGGSDPGVYNPITSGEPYDPSPTGNSIADCATMSNPLQYDNGITGGLGSLGATAAPAYDFSLTGSLLTSLGLPFTIPNWALYGLVALAYFGGSTSGYGSGYGSGHGHKQRNPKRRRGAKSSRRRR